MKHSRNIQGVHQILCISLKCFDSASSAAALVFYLPLCTLTDNERKPREDRVWNIFQNFRKNTIFNEHPVVRWISNENSADKTF